MGNTRKMSNVIPSEKIRTKLIGRISAPVLVAAGALGKDNYSRELQESEMALAVAALAATTMQQQRRPRKTHRNHLYIFMRLCNISCCVLRSTPRVPFWFSFG